MEPVPELLDDAPHLVRAYVSSLPTGNVKGQLQSLLPAVAEADTQAAESVEMGVGACDTEYEVEAIVGHVHGADRKWYVVVQWEGGTTSEEPLQEVWENASRRVDAYLRTVQGADQAVLRALVRPAGRGTKRRSS